MSRPRYRRGLDRASWWRSPLPVLSILVTAEFVVAGVLVRMIVAAVS